MGSSVIEGKENKILTAVIIGISLLMSRRLTSPTQFEMLVSFMEEHGDLCRIPNQPHGRLVAAQKWRKLTTLLNSVGMGKTKTEEKWRKVWADMKWNIRKKVLKVRQSAEVRGQRPNSESQLTNLDTRVLALMDSAAAAPEFVEVLETEQDVQEPADVKPTQNSCETLEASGSHEDNHSYITSNSSPTELSAFVRKRLRHPISHQVQKRIIIKSPSDLAISKFEKSDNEWRKYRVEKLKFEEERMKREDERMKREDDRMKREEERLKREDERMKREEERMKREEERMDREHMRMERERETIRKKEEERSQREDVRMIREEEILRDRNMQDERWLRVAEVFADICKKVTDKYL